MNNDNYLQHYGVMGMRWGIRRAEKTLSSSKSTAEKKQKAVESLKKHREKATKKIDKLQKSHVKLAKRRDANTVKADVKAQSLRKKASVTRNKAYGFFVSKKRSDRLLYKANKLDARADVLVQSSNKVKTNIKKNEKMQEMFNAGVSNIDKALVAKGKLAAGAK